MREVIGVILAVVALLALIVTVVAIVGAVRASRQGQSMSEPLSAAAVFGVVFVLAGSCGALISPTERPPEEAQENLPPVEEPEGPQEQAPAPEPPEELSVEEKITAAGEGAGDTGAVEDVEVTEQVAGDVGRYGVLVKMESQEMADATLLGAMEDHQDVYHSLYTSDVADQISDVAVVSRVDGPTMTLDPAFKTSIDSQTAEVVDWSSEEEMSNLPAVWNVEYIAPELQQQG
jgi:hypothetical protein